jgi:hypothetical protein
LESVSLLHGHGHGTMAAPPTRSYEDRDVSVQGQGKLLDVFCEKPHFTFSFFNQKSQM